MEYNACCGVLPRFSLRTQVFNLLATGDIENSQLSVSPSADLSRSSCPHLGLCLHPVMGTYIEYKSPVSLPQSRATLKGHRSPRAPCGMAWDLRCNYISVSHSWSQRHLLICFLYAYFHHRVCFPETWLKTLLYYKYFIKPSLYEICSCYTYLNMKLKNIFSKHKKQHIV